MSDCLAELLQLSSKIMTKKSKVNRPETTELNDGFKLQLESPEFASASVCNYLQLHKNGSVEGAVSLLPPLINQMIAIKQGDLTEVERILYSQSITLQTAFNRFMAMAALSQHNGEQCDRFASLALKAQEQCRKTLATLVDLKNPKKPTQFIKSYVDKQINQLRVEGQDNVTESAALHLEPTQNAKVDIRSQTKTGGTDLELETVGEINGSGLGGRQSKSLPK